VCMCVLLKIMRGRDRCCNCSYTKRADKIDIEYATPPSPSLSSSSSTPSSFPLLPYIHSLTFHSTQFHLVPFLPFLVFIISTSMSEIIHAFLSSFLPSFLPSFPKMLLESAGYSLKYTTHSFLPFFLLPVLSYFLLAVFDSFYFVICAFNIQNLQHIHLKSILCRRLFESNSKNSLSSIHPAP
jgi:hypothetical protein